LVSNLRCSRFEAATIDLEQTVSLERVVSKCDATIEIDVAHPVKEPKQSEFSPAI
jgi:hypothetical protein